MESLPVIDRKKCDNCEACVDVCENEMFVCEDGFVYVGNSGFCLGCYDCISVCDQGAIFFE